MKLKEKLDSSKYCPDSCDSLYGDKCIMRINPRDDKYYFRLMFESNKLNRRYIRREDCPIKGKVNE